MKNRVTIIFTVSILLIVFLPFTAFFSSTSEASAKKIIGVILPFSSPFEKIANEQKNAIQMAVSEVDKNVELIFKDGRSDATGAIKAFNEFILMENPPIAIISSASWASGALHSMAAEKGIFHIAIASAVFKRTEARHTVRFTLSAQMEEHQLAEYLTRFKRIAILNMDNSYGNNWADIIKNNFKNRIAASISYDPGKKDFGPELTCIKEAKPDVLVLLSAGKAANIVKQARTMGITAQFAGTRTIERPELLTEPQYSNGLVYTSPSYCFKHKITSDYEKAYGIVPTIFAIEAYDAMSTFLCAVNEGDNSPEALFNWYAGRTYTGALGEVCFDEKGDAAYPYMYKQIVDGRFQPAEFQFALLLEKTSQQIYNIFNEMLKGVEQTAQKLSSAGLTGREAKNALQALYEKNEHAFDCATVDLKGIIVNVAPAKFSSILGADISSQEQIVRMLATQKPLVSYAIDTVEGFVGFDLEYPVFSKDGDFIGSVSILTEPDFFDIIISQKVTNFPVEIWMMQKDGRIIYDVNKEEIGKNLFTDPLYAKYPSLLKVAREMALRSRGSSRYEFLDKKMDKTVMKNIIWTTILMHGTEFRLALASIKNK